MARGFGLTVPNHLFDLLPNGLQRNAKLLQRLRRHALTLMDQAKQQMLSADVVVIEHFGLVLGQNDHAACTIGKSLKQYDSLNSRPSPKLPGKSSVTPKCIR